MSTRSSLYSELYVYVLTPIRWTVQAAAVFEIIRNILGGHRGIATLARRVAAGGLVVAFALSLVALGPDLSNRGQAFPVLLAIHVGERMLVSTLAIEILIVAGFLLYLPVPVSRNSVIYCAGWGAFLLIKSVALVYRNAMGPQVANVLSLVSVGVAVAFQFACAIWLTPAGELRKHVAGARRSPEDVARMSRTLEEMNATLLRASGR